LRDEASEVTLLLNEANEAYSMRMLFFSAIAASSNKLFKRDKKQFAVSFLNILANNFLPLNRALAFKGYRD